MEYVIFAIALVVLAVVATVGLVVRPGRRGGRPPRLDRRPGDSGTTATGTPIRSVSTVESPTAPPPGTSAPEATAASAEPDVAAEAPAAPSLDVPAPVAGRLGRLRARLARSQGTLGRGLLALLSRDVLDDEVWEEVEDTLLTADVGVRATTEIVERLRTAVRVSGARTPGELRELLRQELLTAIGTGERALRTLPHEDRPAVVLVVGVNGTGKTTTCGKLARVLVADGRSVLLGAADTFRAAAADQLQTWGSRVGAETVRGAEGADPASVAFEAVKEGIERRVDTVLIDTAGRLHTKAGLMDELGKLKRVTEKQSPIDEVLLVLDATTGQNGVVQARVFTEVVEVTGIVLTKLDGTAKGGIVVAVQRELGVPVKLVGLGEGPDDLAPFEPEEFVDALLSEPAVA